MSVPFYRPKPAPAAVFKDVPLPIRTANPISRFFFHWVTPMIKVGYSRPLREDGKFFARELETKLIIFMQIYGA